MDHIIFSAMAGAVSGFILGLAIIASLSAVGSMIDDKYGTAVVMVLIAIGLLIGLTYGMVATNKNKLNSR